MFKSSVSQVIQKLESNSVNIHLSRNLNIKNGKLFFGQNNEFEIRVADTIDLREQAYRLIYQIYLKKKFIEPHPSEMWFSKHDLSSSTITLVVLKNKKIVGALTLINGVSKRFPANDLYGDELSGSARLGNQSVELVSFGIDPLVRGSAEILTKLFNVAYIISKEINDKDYFVITVNPRHVSFYMKKLSFEERGSLKKCLKVCGAPSKLLILDLEISKQFNKLSDQGKLTSKNLYKNFIFMEDVKKVIPYLKIQIRNSQKTLKDTEELIMKRDEIAEDLDLLVSCI
ncbi:MAG: hypothetical protein COA79_25090 [Planctomycetota bacterium]|nr:MAG: hypothetical protein COA79_25090 [Planctomycetota bacterium]